MACFLVPAVEAAVLTIVKKAVKSKENRLERSGKAVQNRFSKKLDVLTNMLWGGSTLLAFEHLWHGEIVPWAPFLTAAENPEDTAQMLYEISTTGVCMALLTTAVWGVVMLASHISAKKQNKLGEAV